MLLSYLPSVEEVLQFPLHKQLAFMDYIFFCLFYVTVKQLKAIR